MTKTRVAKAGTSSVPTIEPGLPQGVGLLGDENIDLLLLAWKELLASRQVARRDHSVGEEAAAEFSAASPDRHRLG